MGKPNILFWDIEATNLVANFGICLSVSWKRQGEKKVNNVNIGMSSTYKKDHTDDREVVKQAAEALGNADMWVTWYGKRYDVPFINTRLILHKMGVLPPVPHVDGWEIARYKMKLNSNRLATVQTFLDIEEKTPLNGPIWIRAGAGYKDALKYVVEHNDQDCRTLEQAYDRIKCLAPQHPNVNVMAGHTAEDEDICPRCYSEGKLQARGKIVSRSGWRQRFQCTKCGGWSSGKHTKVKSIF